MTKTSDVSGILGKRLRHLRKEKELTQEELAERAGVNSKYYVQVERGQRNVSVGCLQKIADGLGISLEDLFRFPGNRDLTKDEEEIIALVTRLITEGNKKSKNIVRAMLQEIIK